MLLASTGSLLINSRKALSAAPRLATAMVTSLPCLQDEENYSRPMRIVVIGGQGLLGTALVQRLEARGVTVSSASRRTGVDLATGTGLEAALDGVDCVVHAATHRIRHRRVDLGGTRRMIKILAARSTPPHVMYISIVGCDRV